NQPELTKQKYPLNKSFCGAFFKKRPPGGPPEAKAYRTGDLAKWLPDGNIEFLGRIDHQVKIRGFRVELGEIETRLLEHGGVKEAVVIDRKQERGETYLCAYVVPKQGATEETGIDTAELRKNLTAKLPDYMVPTYFVPMETIPLTPNLKIDRRALPEPEVTAVETYVAPTGRIQNKLTAIWADVLAIPEEKISIDSDFFAIGGHSLRATVMAAKIHKELDVKIPLAEIFKKQTVRALAEAIENTARSSYAGIEPAEKKRYYPMSAAQKRMYIVQQMGTGDTAYNMSYILPLKEEVHQEKITKTFRRLIRRHESFRTGIHMIDDQPVQEIQDREIAATFTIEKYETKQETPGTPGEVAQREEEIVNGFIRPFDLSKAPLLRVGTLTRSNGEIILMVDMNHIITDGTSQEILAREFFQIYTGKELPELRLQYKDYAQWRSSRGQQQLMEKQEEYWQRTLSGELPVLELPTDYPRPAVQDFDRENVRFQLENAETRRIKETAADINATLYM
ncbi:MAG: AMP-binding protein, partial [bacterium]|nr:AMP-binding protein [bacterium]